MIESQTIRALVHSHAEGTMSQFNAKRTVALHDGASITFGYRDRPAGPAVPDFRAWARIEGSTEHPAEWFPLNRTLPISQVVRDCVDKRIPQYVRADLYEHLYRQLLAEHK